MSAPAFLSDERADSRVFGKAFVAALGAEIVLLTAVGVPGHWLAHPQTNTNETRFIEAEIFQIPPEAHLVDESKPVAAPVKHEVAISKTPKKGRDAKPEEKKLDDENETQGGVKLAPTHGPVAVFAPAPVIPAYLQSQDLHASVVIEFLVTSAGVATPRLIGSSGNEELDAIALKTVARWQFRAAEQEHHAIDAKVRLRIVFDVK